MDVATVIELVTQFGIAGLLLFLYMKQDQRMAKLEDKYLALIDRLLEEVTADSAPILPRS